MFDGTMTSVNGPHLVETKPRGRKSRPSLWAMLLASSLGLHTLIYFTVKIEGNLHPTAEDDSWKTIDFQVELVRPQPLPKPEPIRLEAPKSASKGNARAVIPTPGLTGVRTAKTPLAPTTTLQSAGSNQASTGRTAGSASGSKSGIGWSDGNEEGDKVRKALRGSVACMHQDGIKLTEKERANCEQRLSTLGKDAPDLGPAGAIKNNERYQQSRSKFNDKIEQMEALRPDMAGVFGGTQLIKNRDTRPPNSSETDERANTQVAPWLKPKPKPAEPFVGKEPPRTKPLE